MLLREPLPRGDVLAVDVPDAARAAAGPPDALPRERTEPRREDDPSDEEEGSARREVAHAVRPRLERERVGSVSEDARGGQVEACGAGSVGQG